MSSAGPAGRHYDDYPRLGFAESRRAARELLALDGEGRAVDDAMHMRIARFYAREARLLDAERYDEWYELLADDLFYWCPLRQNLHRREKRAEIAPDHMALFDDHKADIAMRIGRLASNKVWTEDPPTRHVYLVSNIEAFETGQPGIFETHSTFLQYRNRAERDEATLAGRRRDLLRLSGEDFLIARRLILLPQAVLQTKNLSVFF